MRSVGAPVGRGDRRDERRDEDPGRPQRRPGRDPLGPAAGHLDRHRAIVDADDPRPGPDDRAEPLELAPGRRRAVLRIRRQDPVHRLDEEDPRPGRVDRAEVAAERVAGDLAEGAGQLDAGRPAADEHERHPLAPPLGVVLALGRLERDQDPAPDLEARRRATSGPARPPPSRRGRSRRSAPRRRRSACRRRSGRRRTSGPRARSGSRSDRLAEQDRRVPLAAQDRAERLGDVARRDGAGRDLVEERREQEVVAPVDDGHLDPLVAAELLRGIQAAEAAADDQDAVPVGGQGRVRPRAGPSSSSS